jgi:transcription regulator MmyB-like protein
MLAGLSVEYYTRMERGQLGGASESVLDAIARALQLNAPSASPPITASAQQVLDSMNVPAVVQNGRLDLLAANDLGRALYADLFDMAQQPPNFAR